MIRSLLSTRLLRLSAIVLLVSASTTFAQLMLTVAPANMGFGVVSIGNTKTMTMIYKNISNQDITISSFSSLANTYFAVAANAQLPITLAPNQSLAIAASFSPQTAGAQTATLLATTSPANQAPAVMFTGTTGVPQITYSTRTLNFGDVKINTTATLSLTLNNVGNTNVTFYTARVGNNQPPVIFTVGTNFPLTINAGATVTLPILCSPVALGTEDELLYLSYGAQGLVITDTFTVSCNGIQKIARSGDASGLVVRQPEKTNTNISVGKATAMNFVLDNETDNTITITNATFSGTDASVFTLSMALPFTVSAHSKGDLKVLCTPTSSGDIKAQLDITTSQEASGAIPFALRSSSTSGVQDIQLSTTAMYPNPVTSVLNLNLPENSSKAEIWSINGALLSTVSTINQTQLQWNLESQNGEKVSTGLYIVRVYTPSGIYSGTIVVQ
ncbi:MAG: choice-of-anchor D domain-containing protein [Bacteriodetes bacterium]|nr:choice-of-anchor D domain-containing protein [Bacteroidota bacterium]